MLTDAQVSLGNMAAMLVHSNCTFLGFIVATKLNINNLYFCHNSYWAEASEEITLVLVFMPMATHIASPM